jgi:catechol 2,3-dioxygenase-like lactoylglutathione lyase family enzyme
MDLPIAHIDHVALTVSDLESMIAYFERVLGARRTRPPYRVGDAVAIQQLTVGDAMLSLHRLNNGVSLVAASANIGSLDICLRWNAPIAAALDHLREQQVEVIEGPVARRSADGQPAQSVYFRDPDGNLIELLSTVV